MIDSIDVIVGGQFGSESKGRVTAEVIQKHTTSGDPLNAQVVSVRVGGPNAGHVVVDELDNRFAMRQLPVGFIYPDVQLFIAAGSEVDLEVLNKEILEVEAAGYQVRDRLIIHPQATWLQPRHIKQEQESQLTNRVGSTAKGIGAARADRIWRTARLVEDIPLEVYRELIRDVRFAEYDSHMTTDPRTHYRVVIEGTQGYGLGLHAGHYPQCTSNDARAIDFLAQAGIMPWDAVWGLSAFRVHVVVRPNPIRVAGNSGPLQGETSWNELGLPDERTTVTNKVRRVGEFSAVQVEEAVIANGAASCVIHLAMGDHVAPEIAGVNQRLPEHDAVSAVSEIFAGLLYARSNHQVKLERMLKELDAIAPVMSIGTGPRSSIKLY